MCGQLSANDDDYDEVHISIMTWQEKSHNSQYGYMDIPRMHAKRFANTFIVRTSKM